MIYRLVYTKTAVKDIQKLDIVAKKRIRKKMEIFIKKPLFYSKKLINPAIGSFRFRIGNFRVVFEIDKDKIVVLRVGHRREIYK